MSPSMYTARPRRPRTSMPGYDVLFDRASEPQMAPNSREESRHMYQTEGHRSQIQHSVPRRTRGNHRLPLAQTNEEHELFGQPHYSDIQSGGDFYQGQGADWSLTSSDDAEALSSTGVMPNLSAQDSVSQHPWSVSYESHASVPYQSERMSIPPSQPQGYMSPFLQEGQGERASSSLSYQSGWRAQDLSQNHDHSRRQRSTHRSAQDQDYPQSRINRSAQQGRYDTLRGNDYRTQGNRDHSFDLSWGGVNATNLTASGLFSSYNQHNRHVNRPTGLAVKQSQSSLRLDLAAQSNRPESQERQEHLQSDSGPIAPAITISSAETYPEVPNSRRLESESSRIRDSPSNSQDKVRREHGTKGKANEGKLRVPRSEDRRRRDHVPRPRSRVLTDEGREHAKQVRKVGACKDCRGRHIRCEHTLGKERQNNPPSSPDRRDSWLSIDSESSGHSSDYFSSSVSDRDSPWPSNRPLPSDNTPDFDAFLSMELTALPPSAYSSAQSSNYFTSPIDGSFSSHAFDRAYSSEPQPYSPFNNDPGYYHQN